MKIKNLPKKILKALYSVAPTPASRAKILRLCGYTIGKDAYLPSSLIISDLSSRRKNVVIGERVSIAPSVCIITDSAPNNSELRKIYDMVSKNVVIEKDAWIGSNVTILPGVTIGKCSIIGAGSVVINDIPEYSIAVGAPAKVIKKIDSSKLYK